MMESPLKRTTTNGSDVEQSTDGVPLSSVISSSSTSTSRTSPNTRLNARSTSTHALLAANTTAELRRTAHTEASMPSTERASLSMPPPLKKPIGDRRMSASITSLRSARLSDDLARSPPTSVKSLDDRQPFTTAPSPQVSSTATDTTVVTTSSSTLQMPGLPVLSPPDLPPSLPNPMDLVPSALPAQMTSPTLPQKSEPLATQNGTSLPPMATAPKADSVASGAALPKRAPRSTVPRSISSTRRLSTATQKSDTPEKQPKKAIGTIGVCALDVKARSRPSRQILTRLQGDGDFEVVVFGDKSILDEDVENWPICDFLIAFFSEGFPLDKAISYVKLRKPFVVNDLSMQKILWDRRLCLKILDQMQVPTPKRIEVVRDGGAKLASAELAQHLKRMSGVTLEGPSDGTGGGATLTRKVLLIDDGDTLLVDGQPFKKPFVEKPISGEDHNVIIYFPRSHEGGGARRLFRKIGNKSSEFDPNLIVPRCLTEEGSSYIYEQFLKTENAEDVKAYTVGPDFCHAETRKSPVVDGLVKRNTHGKELRYVTKLNDAEKEMASRVSIGFGQRICGFDLLRAGSQSFVIDVNGWSFVKDNEDYYNDCASILRAMFSTEKFKQDGMVVDDSVADVTPEVTSYRQSNGSSTLPSHSHRSTLRTILKSPSMSKLSAHIPHSSRHSHGSSSPRPSTMTVPMSSPPSLERPPGAIIPPFSPTMDKNESLPPPLISPDGFSEAASEEVIHLSADKEEPPPPMPSSKHSWKLKGVVTVIRHADRTPKQKLKFTAHSQVFADLLKGHHEEVLLKGEAALSSVEAAVKTAQLHNLEDQDKLRNLRNALAKKGKQPGTKVQIKPMFRKRKPDEMTSDAAESPRLQTNEASIPENTEVQTTESPSMERGPPSANDIKRFATRSDSLSGATFSRFSAAENDLILDKLQLVMKWGGEPTHSAQYQSTDLGANMRDDFKLLNKSVVEDVRIFTSSEKRVRTSAQIWAAAFMGRQDIPEDYISVRKDLLDDSNAAKDVMDKVKKKLKHLLREGNSVPESFAWPKDVAEPYVVMQSVIDLLKFHRKVMRHNFKKLSSGAAASLAALNNSGEKDIPKDNKEPLTVTSIQSRWCTGEDAELFKERWEKLFAEFCDSEKADPSKVSELYDTMKYDALHNKQFLEWVFTPSQSLIDEMSKEDAALSQNTSPEPERIDEASSGIKRHESVLSLTGNATERHSFAQKIGFRRKSVLAQPPPTPPLASYEQDVSYFKLFSGSGHSKLKQDKRLGRLRELYRYAKILFDYVGPQEYGISDREKLEIGLLTSLPLLREIVQDLEELQASGDAKSFIYFTKESHIYTLLNCIMEGGLHTKIKRSAIPELDYLSQICFELYEAGKDADDDNSESTYSIRISISPGCHTIDPLDVSLDSKHAIGSAPRRSLTNHQDWKEVISILKAKFGTVELPKSFLAVNVSEKHEREAEEVRAGLQEDDGEMKGPDAGEGLLSSSPDGLEVENDMS